MKSIGPDVIILNRGIFPLPLIAISTTRTDPDVIPSGSRCVIEVTGDLDDSKTQGSRSIAGRIDIDASVGSRLC